MRRVLQLNAGYEPMKFITDQDAMEMWLGGRAEIVTNIDGSQSIWGDMHYTTVSTKFVVPATIRLLQRVKSKQKRPLFRKKVMFNRDEYRCQYCGCKVRITNGTKANPDTAEIEHIIPKSRGGKNSWLNCVTACHSCNKKKRNRTPEEAGMSLIKQPIFPTALHFWDVRRDRSWHPDWDTYAKTF